MARHRLTTVRHGNPQPRRRLRYSTSDSSSPVVQLSPTALKCLLYLCTVLFFMILIESHRSIDNVSTFSTKGRLPGRLRESFHLNRKRSSSNDISKTSNDRWHFNRYQRSILNRGGSSSQPRIAIVLPFIGNGPESIPPYLGLFCHAAGGAASLVDFLIFHPGVLDTYAERTGKHMCPPNVKFINLQSMEALASNYLMRLMNHVPEDEWVGDGDILVRVMTKHLTAYPYALVELKPAFGHIFADFLVDYTHWGYSDLDIVFGDLSRWITQDELTEYDIVTYGFGDQNRVYLRGQFTFHRNIPKINQIWRHCEYLSRLDQRFGKVLSGEQKLKFESAEGCYSAAVLSRQDVRVKYATKAFTDIQEADSVYSHGLYIARQKHSPRKRNMLPYYRSQNRLEEERKAKKVVIYKAKSKRDGAALLHSPQDWFEHDKIYRDRTQPLQWEIGRKEIIELNGSNSKKNCMYWAQEKYQSQLCVSSNVTEFDTVFWVNGRLYKQRYENAKLETKVATAPFFHFQEWKRYYREGQLLAFRPDSDFTTFVLTKEGAIPVYPRNDVVAPPLASLSSEIMSPLGKSILHWKAGNVDFDRQLLPLGSYCLISAPRTFPPVPPAPQCSQQTSWWDSDNVHILSMAPAWQTDLDLKLDVTLVLTLQIPIYQSSDSSALDGLLDLIIGNLNRWQGQACVIVFHVAVDDEGHQDDVLALMEARFSEEGDMSTTTAGKSKNLNRALHLNGDHAVDETTVVSPLFGIDSCLIALMFSTISDGKGKDKKKNSSPTSYHVSRKALLNMAIDAVPTRWFVSGIELERGMMLSTDAAFFSHRAAISHQHIPGNIFWIPQFALDIEDDFDEVLTLTNLIEFQDKGGIVKEPIEFEEGACDDGEAGGKQKADPEKIFDDITTVWWDILKTIVNNSSSYTKDETLTSKRAKVSDELQLRLVELLTNEKHYDLFAMDESPILLTDNQGPRNGMLTNEIAREVEEFGGKLCYNAMRLAQLATLGYNINVLPGGFAASTGTSRTAALRNGLQAGGLGDDGDILGASRCDGCFFFDEDHEMILEGISKDERKRPAKAAVLWEEKVA